MYLGLSGSVVFHSPPTKLARVGDIVGDLMRKVNVSLINKLFSHQFNTHQYWLICLQVLELKLVEAKQMNVSKTQNCPF